MENKMSSRIAISDKIFNMLPTNEQEAMQIWHSSHQELVLRDEDLPEIDVLTCVYNAESYISNAIKSVLLQSYPNVHLIIVTDPCTDKTIDIIKEHAGKYQNITLVENTEHKGIIECFNIGLSYCRNQYIARMDLDDLIHPMRFEMQLDYLKKHPEVSVVSAWMKIFNEKHETRNVTYRDDFELQKISMLYFSPISHAASIFRAEVLKEFGYRNEYKYAEDYDLWFRIMGKYQTAVFPRYLYLYRTHSNQVTNERNLQIIKASWIRIMNNVFQKLNMNYSDDDVLFHIEHFQQGKIPSDKAEWLRLHNWLNLLVKSNQKSNFFNKQKLKEFIFKNQWQSGFEKFKKELSITELMTVLNSLIYNGNLIAKTKEIIKHIIKK